MPAAGSSPAPTRTNHIPPTPQKPHTPAHSNMVHFCPTSRPTRQRRGPWAVQPGQYTLDEFQEEMMRALFVTLFLTCCTAEDRGRYTLGEFKEELMRAMGLDTEGEGSAMQFLRRGYKVGDGLVGQGVCGGGRCRSSALGTR